MDKPKGQWKEWTAEGRRAKEDRNGKEEPRVKLRFQGRWWNCFTGPRYTMGKQVPSNVLHLCVHVCSFAHSQMHTCACTHTHMHAHTHSLKNTHLIWVILNMCVCARICILTHNVNTCCYAWSVISFSIVFEWIQWTNGPCGLSLKSV